MGIPLGTTVGALLGTEDGADEGRLVGFAVGIVVGTHEGTLDGCDVGIHVGTALGVADGMQEGCDVGIHVGTIVGIPLGTTVGALLGTEDEGRLVGFAVGIAVGRLNSRTYSAICPPPENDNEASIARKDSAARRCPFQYTSMTVELIVLPTLDVSLLYLTTTLLKS